MPPVLYSVLATLPSSALAREYLAWLLDGHVQAVVDAGARSGSVTRLDPPQDRESSGETVQILSQYVFSSLEDFARYEREDAPRLRSEGRARFGPERNITMMRMLGEIVLQLPE